MIATKINESSLVELLGTEPFIPIKGQLLYRDNGNVLITCIQKENHYTAEDYQKLPIGAPYQLINGKLKFMASPFALHQIVSANLSLELGAFIKKNKLGKLLNAPLDVHFDETNIYQTDLLFISQRICIWCSRFSYRNIVE